MVVAYAGEINDNNADAFDRSTLIFENMGGLPPRACRDETT